MPGFELFGAAERESVAEVLDTGVLMRYGFDPMRKGRWKALELEAALAQRMGTRHAHLVSSDDLGRTCRIYLCLVEEPQGKAGQKYQTHQRCKQRQQKLTRLGLREKVSLFVFQRMGTVLSCSKKL